MKQRAGLQEITTFDHPMLAANFIKNMNSCYKELISYQESAVLNAIKSHMGQWNISKYSSFELPKPRTLIEKFVHLCDYLASRKFIEINFDSVEYLKENNENV